MLQLRLICVGGLKEPFYQDACREYAKRLTPHCRLEITELAEERLSENPSPAQIDRALEKEAAQIFRALPKQAALGALCVEGRALSSEALSETLRQWMAAGRSQVAFVIGGSFGLHASVKDAALLRLSMSEMTFPHHLARVMLLEQLYRATQIAQGTRYHK